VSSLQQGPGPGPVAPSRTDPVVAGASEVIGGPWGRRAVRPPGWLWTPIRIVMLLTVLVCLAGWLEKAPCRDPGAWTQQHQYTAMCYSDVEALYFGEGLAAGQLPYADHPVEYPVLTGGMMAAASLAAHEFGREGSTPAETVQAERFFDITALMLTVCALVMAWSTARLAGRRRVWDAAMVALAPVLLLQAFTNWDLLAVALTGVGLWAWSRDRPWVAGAALGLGVAAKLYPALILLIVLPALAARARRPGPAGRALLAGAVAWSVVDVPIWLAYPSAFGRFFALNFHRGADFDTLWYAVQYLGWTSWRGDTLSIAVGVTMAVLIGGVVLLVLLAPRAPRLAQVAFLVVLAFLLANKVWSPQYSLWLLPLAVLARPRWGTFLLWQGCEVWLLVTRFSMFVGLSRPGEGLPQAAFLWAVLARDLSLCLIAALVVLEVLRPGRDVVRQGDPADPAAGPLAGRLLAAPPLFAFRRPALVVSALLPLAVTGVLATTAGEARAAGAARPAAAAGSGGVGEVGGAAAATAAVLILGYGAALVRVLIAEPAVRRVR
jgi:uncharacterized membrane protein